MACTQRCNQGRSCTCAYPLATGQSLKALPQAPRARNDRKDQFLHLAEWLALTAAMVFAMACIAGFFKFGA